MKRICLFAGYDSKNIIHDYVIYYLKELSTVADVYYMADNEISDEEKAKIAPYTKEVYGYKHGKYDFGSWQELIKIIGWEKLAEYDELILANDSVFGPLYPMEELFKKLEQDKEWDICGINRGICKNVWHISSYFLVFKKNAFVSDIFKRHLADIKQEANVEEVVQKYECTFMEKFYNQGYILRVLTGLDKHIYIDWREYIKHGNPFVKKKVFLKSHFLVCKTYGWENYISKHTKYPVELINSYLKNNSNYSEDRMELIKSNQLEVDNSLYKKIRQIRKWLLQINIKRNRKTVRIFGIYLINKDKRSNPISQIKMEHNK